MTTDYGLKTKDIMTIHFAHVGVQKTGSTWLQTGLFAHHPDLRVVPCNVGDEKLAAVSRELYQVSDYQFDAAAWRTRFDGLLARELNGWDGIVGLSNEQLSGH